MTSDPQLVARLLDLVARQLHSSNACKDLVAGQWAILRYLETAGQGARTAQHIATYLGSSLPETRLALASLVRKQLLEPQPAASNEAYQQTTLARDLKNADPVQRAADAIGTLSTGDREEFAQLLEAVAEKLA